MYEQRAQRTLVAVAGGIEEKLGPWPRRQYAESSFLMAARASRMRVRDSVGGSPEAGRGGTFRFNRSRTA